MTSLFCGGEKEQWVETDWLSSLTIIYPKRSIKCIVNERQSYGEGNHGAVPDALSSNVISSRDKKAIVAA